MSKRSVLSKLQSQLKSLSKKLKKFRGSLHYELPTLAGAKRLAANTMCALLCMCALTLLITRAPEAHDLYIRSKVGSRVYTIKAELNGGGGTGFQLKAPSGTDYVVTNSHVCDYIEAADDADHKQTVLVVSDDGSWMRRRIVAISDRTDLCLIEGMPNVDGLSLGSEPSMGEHLMVVGHPHLRPTTLSAGELIGSQDVQIMDFIMSVKDNPFIAAMLPTNPDGKCNMPKNQIKVIPIPAEIGGGEIDVCFTNTLGAYMTSAVIYPGNSGSPVVDFYGRVVGVAFAADSRDNFGDVVSLYDLQTFIAKY